MTRRLLTLAATALAAANAMAQTSAAISADDLRLRIAMFAHDSMQGRATGTIGSARAVEYLAREAARAGAMPAGDARTFFQAVPISRVGMLGGFRGMTAGDDDVQFGTDVLPLPGMEGVPLPRFVEQRGRTMMYGGRIGGKDMTHPGNTDGKIVIFDAPLRANGQVDYQIWRDGITDTLALYRDARAILIVALDAVPRSVIEKFSEPWLELPGMWKPKLNVPPVALITRGLAGKLRYRVALGGSLNFRATSRGLDVPARNVVARIEGSDPIRKSEVIVVSAHSDHMGDADGAIHSGANAGSGAVALLEIAEHIASLPVKPARSLLFVWTVAGEQGDLGARWFSDSSGVPRAAIVARVGVEDVGFGTAAPCADAHSAFSLAGIPSVLIAGESRRADRSASEDPASLDFVSFAQNTRFAAEQILELASRAERPAQGRVIPTQTGRCSLR